MKTTHFILTALFFLTLGMASSSAQISYKALPQPQTMATIGQQVGYADVTFVFSRPSALRRRVYGKLLSYDDLWPLGAKFVTTLLTNEDIKIEGIDVPPGEYSMFAIPDNENQWEMVINTNSTLSGAVGYQKSEDVGRFKLKTMDSDYYNEDFGVNFKNVQSESADVEMGWSNKSAVFSITTDTYVKVVQNLESTNAKAAEYLDAAKYFYQSTEAPGHTIELLNKSINIERTSEALYLKSLMLAERKEFDEALINGTEAKKLAKKEGNKEIEKLVTDSMERWSRKEGTPAMKSGK